MTQAFSTLRAANAARQAEWDPSDKITLAYRGNEMGGECGEAQNVIKKLERERLGIPGSRASIAQLAEELADVVICADLIAMGEGIDLDLAVAHKFNLTSEKVGLKTRLMARDEPSAPPVSADRLQAIDAHCAQRAKAAWSKFENDFANMTDKEIAQVSRDEQDKLDEAEEWLEAVAAWEAAGKPRKSKEAAAQ